MSEPDELDERDQVQRWQVLMLLELGFTIEQSMLLVSVRDFRLEDARGLRARGCPHELVVEILT